MLERVYQRQINGNDDGKRDEQQGSGRCRKECYPRTLAVHFVEPNANAMRCGEGYQTNGYPRAQANA
jgi:hypothetical protein